MNPKKQLVTFIAVAIAAFAVVLCLLLTGCPGPQTPTEVAQEKAAVFATHIQLCIAKARLFDAGADAEPDAAYQARLGYYANCANSIDGGL